MQQFHQMQQLTQLNSTTLNKLTPPVKEQNDDTVSKPHGGIVGGLMSLKPNDKLKATTNIAISIQPLKLPLNMQFTDPLEFPYGNNNNDYEGYSNVSDTKSEPSKKQPENTLLSNHDIEMPHVSPPNEIETKKVEDRVLPSFGDLTFQPHGISLPDDHSIQHEKQTGLFHQEQEEGSVIGDHLTDNLDQQALHNTESQEANSPYIDNHQTSQIEDDHALVGHDTSQSLLQSPIASDMNDPLSEEPVNEHTFQHGEQEEAHQLPQSLPNTQQSPNVPQSPNVNHPPIQPLESQHNEHGTAESLTNQPDDNHFISPSEEIPPSHEYQEMPAQHSSSRFATVDEQSLNANQGVPQGLLQSSVGNHLSSVNEQELHQVNLKGGSSISPQSLADSSPPTSATSTDNQFATTNSVIDISQLPPSVSQFFLNTDETQQPPPVMHAPAHPPGIMTLSDEDIQSIKSSFGSPLPREVQDFFDQWSSNNSPPSLNNKEYALQQPEFPTLETESNGFPMKKSQNQFHSNNTFLNTSANEKPNQQAHYRPAIKVKEEKKRPVNNQPMKLKLDLKPHEDGMCYLIFTFLSVSFLSIGVSKTHFFHVL